MNTVLDDSMMLCLANGERMKLRSNMRMLFEVQDLAVASPATVSRCGMVYMTPSEIGWMPYVDSWLNRYVKNNSNLPPTEPGKEDQSVFAVIKDLFVAYIDHSLHMINTIRDQEPMRTYDIQNVVSLCNFLEYFYTKEIGKDDKRDVWTKKVLCYFSFAFMWAFGGSFNSKTQERRIDSIVQECFSKVKYPNEDNVFNFFIDPKQLKPVHWQGEVPKEFLYDPKAPYFSILVPTLNTVRYQYILDICI